MDTVLVVTYSYTGISRSLAELMCAQQGWPMGEVSDVHSRKGAAGTVRCMLDSLLRRRPPVRYEGPDPADFRIVVLIAPIWMYRLAGPMRSFVAHRRDSLHRVAVICTMGSRGAVNAVAEIASLLGRTPILTAAFTQREVEDGSCAGRLQELGDALVPESTQSQPVRRPAWSPHAA